MTIYQSFKKNIVNIPGWRTKRKIIVIESDDWGSIRMSSDSSYKHLLNNGFPVDKCHYTRFDSLESNDDLKLLYDVLNQHKDLNNRSPVFTAVVIVGNPDFEKISNSNFSNYYYEPFTETLKRYPTHDSVFELYRVGLDNRLFVPVFHGREHLNVLKWMRELKRGNPSVLEAFRNNITGLSRGINNEKLPDFQAAFHIENQNELAFMEDVLVEGLNLFKKLFGYSSRYFVPTNGPFNNSLEKALLVNGVQFINTNKKQREPLGANRYRTNIRFLGQQNKLGQRYITRNCFFEPSSNSYSSKKSWIDRCIKEIEVAFYWNKPAIISSHRVNYVGYLDSKNRENGLIQLDLLLKRILTKWPEAEFLTSVELGELIISSQ